VPNFKYSLRLILLFANTDVSITKMCLDKSTLVKGIIGRREYKIMYRLKKRPSVYKTDDGASNTMKNALGPRLTCPRAFCPHRAPPFLLATSGTMTSTRTWDYGRPPLDARTPLERSSGNGPARWPSSPRTGRRRRRCITAASAIHLPSFDPRT
jgi:hypothetical protein